MLAAALLPSAAQARRYVVQSTAYCPGSSGTVMANGRHVHFGAVANNMLPLGTRIRMARPVFGRRVFVVEDRIGWGSQLDIWMPSCRQALQWGRRTVAFRVIPR